MVLEECPTTKTENRFWNEKILDKFSVLENASNSKYLSLKEYISERPQKFYNNQVYTDFFAFLSNFQKENPKELIKVLNIIEYELNIAFKHINNKKQLNIFTENSLLDLEEVNYYAFRTAVLAEYFARGYDRYFFSLKSKYSLPGWAGYDGKILKRERKNNTNDLNGYQGVLEDNMLFFIPKIKVPKFIRKIINLMIIAKSNFWIDYHINTDYRFKKNYEFILRDTIPFRRNLSIIINDPSLIIYAENYEELVKIIRRKYKKIVRFTIRKSKKELDTIFSKFLPTKYIRVTIYDTDLRKRKLRNSGLIDSLVCSITLNKSSKIKNIDFIGGKLEIQGNYRIVWNGNWKGIRYVC